MKLKNMLYESKLAKVYDKIEKSDTFQDDDRFADLEDEWTGGIANFGNNRAAEIIQALGGYYDYKDILEQSINKYLGRSFKAYRLINQNQLNNWKNGDDMPPMGITLSRNFAKKFKNFAGFKKSDDTVLIQLTIPSEAVIMRGSLNEDELVIDPNQISFHTIKILEKIK